MRCTALRLRDAMARYSASSLCQAPHLRSSLHCIACMHSAFCASVSQICRRHDTKTLLRTHSRNSFPASESTHYSAFRKSHVCGVPTGGAGRPRGARGQALATTVALDADIHSAATIHPAHSLLHYCYYHYYSPFACCLSSLICYTHSHSPCSLPCIDNPRLLTTPD